MVKNIEWDKTFKHNQSINLEQVPRDFQDAARWVRSSRIGYAVEAQVQVYRIHIQDFWQTAKPETIENARGISATVRNKKIVVTKERIRKVLKLNDNAQDPTSLSKDDILDGFRSMGYAGDFRQKKEIKRNGLTKDWRFIVHVIAMSLCLNHKFNLSGYSII
ncbi:hypothetical protein Hanom_Chr13g01207181 [Helianthus anomalus]